MSAAVADLRCRPGVLELEEAPLKLEEMYTALLARFHHRADRNGIQPAGRPAPVFQEEGDRR